MNRKIIFGLAIALILSISLVTGLMADYKKASSIHEAREFVNVYVELNSPVSIELEGEIFVLNILGANSEAMEIHFAVNDDVKTMTEGQTKTIGGLVVFAEDVFISTIGEGMASANVVVSLDNETPEPNTCIDSDNGINYYEYGEIDGDLVVPQGPNYDLCTADGYIRELFCNEDNLGEPTLYSCPFGCSDGVCLTEELEEPYGYFDIDAWRWVNFDNPDWSSEYGKVRLKAYDLQPQVEAELYFSCSADGMDISTRSRTYVWDEQFENFDNGLTHYAETYMPSGWDYSNTDCYMYFEYGPYFENNEFEVEGIDFIEALDLSIFQEWGSDEFVVQLVTAGEIVDGEAQIEIDFYDFDGNFMFSQDFDMNNVNGENMVFQENIEISNEVGEIRVDFEIEHSAYTHFSGNMIDNYNVDFDTSGERTFYATQSDRSIVDGQRVNKLKAKPSVKMSQEQWRNFVNDKVDQLELEERMAQMS